MIVQDNKYVCTAKELSNMIAKRILTEKPGETDFTTVKFSLLSGGYDGKTEPEVLASGAEGWYGIRKIDTGFDDNGLTLCSNYYGGGYPQFGYFFEGCSEKQIEDTIFLMIVNTLYYAEGTAGPMLISETVYEPKAKK